MSVMVRVRKPLKLALTSSNTEHELCKDVARVSPVLLEHAVTMGWLVFMDLNEGNLGHGDLRDGPKLSAERHGKLSMGCLVIVVTLSLGITPGVLVESFNLFSVLLPL